MAKEPLTEQEQLDLDIKKIEYEERKQTLESKKIQDELARIQLSEKKQELETKKNNKERGKEDARRAIEDRKKIQGICNHHTGGEGAFAIMQGQGDPERPTCMGAMQFLDQSFMVFCQRCFKEWRSTDEPVKWAEGANLWRRSINKQMMVIGGSVQSKVAQIPV